MSVKNKLFIANCIDFRYDHLICEYLDGINYTSNYYNGTTAGAALPFGYTGYCNNKCEGQKNCDPTNPQINTLKESLKLNIQIAQSLSPNLKEIYLLNHQDCGAFKAFLPCSGYPKNLGDNKEREIQINQDVLIYAKQFIKKNFNQDIIIRMGLIDINGSVCDLVDENWISIFKGKGINSLGLWYDKY